MNILDTIQTSPIALPLIILLGLMFGSFATMASYRIPLQEDLVFKPSSCTSCKHRLGFFDLFPVFSWCINFGKCRYCRTKISIRYPLTEIVMASLFAFIYLQLGASWVCAVMLALAVCLVIMSVIDLEHRIIPDGLQIIMFCLAILYRYVVGSELYEYFSGMLFGLIFAFSLRYGFFLWKKREGLGMGDVKFFAVAGMFLGVKAFIPFLFFSGMFGIIFATIWKKLGGEEEFPFGPSLAASMLLCLLLPQYSVDLLFYYG